MIEKKPFRLYGEPDETKTPLAVKLNDQDELMLAAGMYMFNMHSKGGVLKKLAHIGLRYYLTTQSMEEWHYLTRHDRGKLVHDKPNMDEYNTPKQKR